MHIGLMIPGALDTVSGGYLYDRMLVRYLRETGDRVTIFAPALHNYRQRLAFNLDRTWLERIASSDLDVLLQDELAHPALLRLNRRLRGQVPLVTIVHHLRSSERHLPFLLPIYRLVERAYLRSVDGFVFNSRTTQAAVAAIAGKPGPGVVAYPAGEHRPSLNSEEVVRARALAPGPLRLLFVGNVIPRKGLDLLLDALAQLPMSGWRLEVVGALDVAPGYARRLQARVEAQRWGARVRFHGRVSDDGLPGFFAAADLLAMPSHYEGFGIAYLEGMGYGLPAVAGREGAAHEVVTEGETGFLVGRGGAGHLARQLEGLARDRERLAELSVAAFRRHQAHPSWRQSMARVRHFLLHQLAGGAL